MDLKNQLVKHKMLGRGTIVAQDDKYITVAFASKNEQLCVYQSGHIWEILDIGG